MTKTRVFLLGVAFGALVVTGLRGCAPTVIVIDGATIAPLLEDS